MDVLTLIAQARAAGLTLSADGDRLHVSGPLAAKPLLLQLRDHKPAVLALLAREDADIIWREAAFRARIPPHGPIWPPRLRTTPLCDTPGHCSLCGDELVGDPAPRYRCWPCVQALWLVLRADREGLGVSA